MKKLKEFSLSNKQNNFRLLIPVFVIALVGIMSLFLIQWSANMQDRNQELKVETINGSCIPNANIIQDGGFEQNTDLGANPFWMSTSTRFGTSLCTVTGCGTAGGAAAPRTGNGLTGWPAEREQHHQQHAAALQHGPRQQIA